MANIKSMTLEQAKAYQKELKAQGKTESTSKEAGKVADYIKTLQPEKYGEETVTSAYQKLSRGVTTTGGWTEKNLPELNARGIYPKLTSPTTSGAMGAEGDLSGYLSGYQDSVYGAAGSPALRESIVAQLEPEMEKPETINRVEEFQKMREEMGVADLETNLNTLKAQLEEQYAVRRQRTQSAEGKPVAMGVIAGRVGEIERQENERIDAIGRQINVITDQLNTAYNTISTYINYMGMDYQDAVNAYNTEFNRNLQIYNLVDEEIDQQVANARANLQTFQNAIISGNISYGDLPSDQKAFIMKLEAQAGLPLGFTSRLKPEEKVIYSGTRESGGVKYVDYITKNPDGSLNKQSIVAGTSTSGTGGASGTEREQLGYYTTQMNDAISEIKKKNTEMNIKFGDGKTYLTINQAKPLITAWENQGYTEDQWWDRFGSNVWEGQPD